MAGVKRHTDGSDSNRVKKTKTQTSSQYQQQIKPSRVKKSALPSPDDSPVASEDLVEKSFRGDHRDEASAAKEKALTLKVKAKTSTSTQGGEGLPNGTCLDETMEENGY